jgi:carbonic anhydrase
MKRLILLAAMGLLCVPVPGRAVDLSGMSQAQQEQIRAIVRQVIREYAANLNDRYGNAEAKAVLKTVVRDNQNFVRSHSPNDFSSFHDNQHPRATVITCSDSQVQIPALDASPDGDLFVIRNLGNQVVTVEGSVEYGVRHLHTPLLLIVGHVACSVIEAAASNYSQESGPVRRELDTLHIPKGDGGLSSVKLNVTQQVRYAMSKFEKEVLSGDLTVVGAVYDFRNEMGQGQGKINIINVNGETDPASLARLELLQGLDAPPAKAALARRRSKSVKPAASTAGEGGADH